MNVRKKNSVTEKLKHWKTSQPLRQLDAKLGDVYDFMYRNQNKLLWIAAFVLLVLSNIHSIKNQNEFGFTVSALGIGLLLACAIF